MQEQHTQQDLTTSHLKNESTDQHFGSECKFYVPRTTALNKAEKWCFLLLWKCSIVCSTRSHADFSITVRADLINGSLISFSVAVVTAVAPPWQGCRSQFISGQFSTLKDEHLSDISIQEVVSHVRNKMRVAIPSMKNTQKLFGSWRLFLFTNVSRMFIFSNL